MAWMPSWMWTRIELHTLLYVWDAGLHSHLPSSSCTVIRYNKMAPLIPRTRDKDGRHHVVGDEQSAQWDGQRNIHIPCLTSAFAQCVQPCSLRRGREQSVISTQKDSWRRIPGSRKQDIPQRASLACSQMKIWHASITALSASRSNVRSLC